VSLARRFVIVAPNYYPRVCGVGDHSARLGAELLRRGHEVTVFSRQPVEPHPEAPQVVDARGIPGALPVIIGQRIMAAIAELRPTDVIIQYTSQMWDAWRFGTPALALLAARAGRAGAKVTVIAHEPFVPWNRRPDLLWGALAQRASFAALLAASQQLFVTTETRAAAVASYCRAVRAAAPAVMRIGPNALPVPRPAAATHGSPLRIGVFSTAAVGKRFDVVLGAFERVASEFPTAELVLIGDLGPPGLATVREISDALARHPARDRIRVTGKLALRAIAAEVAALDVYLFPMNTGANTRSGTLPVALGSGLPTVSILGAESDPGLFRDGENIVVASALTADAFASATLRVLRDPALQARVREGARRFYEDYVSWERITDELLAVI
jgi:glycosyltransferase involved in cell wall biosynthesis